METLQVRPSDVEPVVHRAMQVNRPIFLWGAPGIGKSELVQGIVDSGSLGNAMLIDMRLALMEPTDLRGYPVMLQVMQVEVLEVVLEILLQQQKQPM